MKARTKLWRHLLPVLTPEWRRFMGSSEFLTCCRSWDTLASWLDDALYHLEHHITCGALTDQKLTLEGIPSRLSA